MWMAYAGVVLVAGSFFVVGYMHGHKVGYEAGELAPREVCLHDFDPETFPDHGCFQSSSPAMTWVRRLFVGGRPAPKSHRAEVRRTGPLSAERVGVVIEGHARVDGGLPAYVGPCWKPGCPRTDQHEHPWPSTESEMEAARVLAAEGRFPSEEELDERLAAQAAREEARREPFQGMRD